MKNLLTCCVLAAIIIIFSCSTDNHRHFIPGNTFAKLKEAGYKESSRAEDSAFVASNIQHIKVLKISPSVSGSTAEDSAFLSAAAAYQFGLQHHITMANISFGANSWAPAWGAY